MKNILLKFKYPVAGIILLILLYFSFRTAILKTVFSKIQHKIYNGYALSLKAEKVRFTGFKTIYFEGLQINQDSSTLLFIDTLKVNPKIFPLLTGKILFREINIQEGKFFLDIKQLRKIRKTSANTPDSLIDKSQISYSRFIYKIINTFFENVPVKLKVNKFTISYQRDTIFASSTINNFLLKRLKYSGNANISDNRINENIIYSGTLDNSDNKISFSVKNADKKPITIPYIGSRWQSLVSFDSIYGDFEVKKYRNGVLDLKLTSGIENFLVKDNRIGPNAIVTKTGKGNLNVRITERAFEIDSTSVLAFNNFQFSPYFKFEKNPNRIVQLKFIRQEFEASKLFKSFPEGLFDNISQLETKGNLIYSLDVSLNLDFPDSATLDSRMEKKDFSIIKYGPEDFRKMNGSFRYEVYDRGRFIRSFIVGPENPDYTPLEQISPYLKYSILTSEDGDFFYHRGFNEDAFKESISKNWAEKRFARGGSTISMQLVKNVFLSRKKTIERKAEEMLIVWIIENLRLSGKNRMFEVYLNIIEWGPDIYGIKEASRFYFNKLPTQLNLKESMFLSSIVPRPKAFKYAFDNEGKLRDHYNGYFRLLSGIMLRRNQISTTDTINLKPDIELTGAAKFYISKQETNREDSIYYIEPKRSLLDRIFKRDDDDERKGLFRKNNK